MTIAVDQDRDGIRLVGRYPANAVDERAVLLTITCAHRRAADADRVIYRGDPFGASAKVDPFGATAKEDVVVAEGGVASRPEAKRCVALRIRGWVV